MFRTWFRTKIDSKHSICYLKAYADKALNFTTFPFTVHLEVFTLRSLQQCMHRALRSEHT